LWAGIVIVIIFMIIGMMIFMILIHLKRIGTRDQPVLVMAIHQVIVGHCMPRDRQSRTH
jgi:hypothetical protein